MDTVPKLKNNIRKGLFYTEERTDNTKKSLTPPPRFSKRGYIYTYFIVHKIAYAVFIIKSGHFVLVFHYESNPFIFYIRTKVLAMETVHRARDCPRANMFCIPLVFYVHCRMDISRFNSPSRIYIDFNLWLVINGN